MLRVVVVDDSPVARDLISVILSSDTEIEVVGVGKNGLEAVELVQRLRPDVVTMDVQMPHMDGYAATKEIMIRQPTPIVVVSGSMSRPDVQKSLNSLEAGALTVIGKPASPQSPEFEQSASELVRTVKSMAQVRVVRHTRRTRAPLRRPADAGAVAPGGPQRLVTIAASTGGPQALHRMLSQLPADFALPILVVQHISAGFTRGLAEWLDDLVPLSVRVAEAGANVQPGHVYFAPDACHLCIVPGPRIELSDRPPVAGFRPSGTVLFESAARTCSADLIAVILTGMGRDGVDGLRAVRQTGGYTIAQDEQTCVVYGMPGAAVEAGLVDEQLPLDQIAERLVELAVAERRKP